MAETVDVDVVVIGAGVSGLSAANQIHKKDQTVRVAVIEAKDRVGGRTMLKELNAASGRDIWDFGGQWIGMTQPHVLALIKELGLDIYPQYVEGKKYMQLAGDRFHTYRSEIPALPWYALIDLHLVMRKIDKMMSLVPIEDPSQCPYAERWDSITMSYFIRTSCWTKGAKEALEVAGRTIFGCEPKDISLLYFLSYMNAASGIEPIISASEGTGGQAFKVKGGAGQLAHLLADKIGRKNIYLSNPVDSIEQKENGVTVTTKNKMVFKCQRVIMATPPPFTALIQHSPPLPVEKDQVMRRMPPGYITKVIVTYAETFWRKNGCSGEVVTNGGPSILDDCSTGPLCVVFDATSSNGNPALVSFIGGNQQIEYSKKTVQERKQAVLESLAGCFGAEALHCLDYAEHDWSAEPYNCGGPVYYGTPGMGLAMARNLRQPFGRLHFAGTESATVWCGFINGAVQAGNRAANEVLHIVRPRSVLDHELSDTAYGPPLGQLVKRHWWKRHSVVRYTWGLSIVCILIVVAKKSYFRMAW